MLRRSLALFALVVPVAVASQRSGASPYTRYAAAITTEADSVVGFLTAQVDSLSNETAVATLAAAADQMQRLTDAFAATTPPADLADIHHELVQDLSLVSGKAAQAAHLMQIALDSANADDKRTSAAELAQHELQDLQTAIGLYQNARARAGQALLQHGARIP